MIDCCCWFYLFIYRLVLIDSVFAKQYVEYGGMKSEVMHQLLKPSNPTGALIDTLLVISQLARISETYYDSIHQAGNHLSSVPLVVVVVVVV